MMGPMTIEVARHLSPEELFKHFEQNELGKGVLTDTIERFKFKSLKPTPGGKLLKFDFTSFKTSEYTYYSSHQGILKSLMAEVGLKIDRIDLSQPSHQKILINSFQTKNLSFGTELDASFINFDAVVAEATQKRTLGAKKRVDGHVFRKYQKLVREAIQRGLNSDDLHEALDRILAEEIVDS